MAKINRSVDCTEVGFTGQQFSNLPWFPLLVQAFTSSKTLDIIFSWKLPYTFKGANRPLTRAIISFSTHLKPKMHVILELLAFRCHCHQIIGYQGMDVTLSTMYPPWCLGHCRRSTHLLPLKCPKGLWRVSLTSQSRYGDSVEAGFARGDHEGGCRGLCLAREVIPCDGNTGGESPKEECKARWCRAWRLYQVEFHPVVKYIEEWLKELEQEDLFISIFQLVTKESGLSYRRACFHDLNQIVQECSGSFSLRLFQWHLGSWASVHFFLLCKVVYTFLSS